MIDEFVLQVAKASGYYIALMALMRLAGAAGQTTTFDLIVLITLSVVRPAARPNTTYVSPALLWPCGSATPS
jgi:hypothetical protein